MASSSPDYLSSLGRPPRSSSTNLASTSISEFHDLLKRSKKIMALCGAGLSAASGLDTFRGKGGMWRNYRAMDLATPEAFEADPGLVWLFYAYRRHKALKANPNMAHYALAELARKMGKENFICLSQNVDGLSQRASHPPAQLKLLHDTLFDIKCFICPYIEKDNFKDPICDVLAIDDDSVTARLASAAKNVQSQIASIDPKAAQTIDLKELPHCPECKIGLLRPGVVWFGEDLPKQTLSEIHTFLSPPLSPSNPTPSKNLDVLLVIGTTATVYPAASYIQIARQLGAKIVVVNMDSSELGSAGSLRKGDFWFEGDAAVILPTILEPIIGELDGVAGKEGVSRGEGVRRDEVGENREEEDEEEEKDEVQRYFESSP